LHLAGLLVLGDGGERDGERERDDGGRCESDRGGRTENASDHRSSPEERGRKSDQSNRRPRLLPVAAVERVGREQELEIDGQNGECDDADRGEERLDRLHEIRLSTVRRSRGIVLRLREACYCWAFSAATGLPSLAVGESAWFEGS